MVVGRVVVRGGAARAAATYPTASVLFRYGTVRTRVQPVGQEAGGVDVYWRRYDVRTERRVWR